MHDRRHVLAGAGALMFSGSEVFAQAASKLMTIVVPFAPGGGNDILARELGHVFGETLDITAIIENRGGAGGLIAAKTVSAAAPNGATVLFVSSSFVTTAAVRKFEPYDVVNGYTPIAMLAREPLLVVTSNQSGFNSVKEIVAQSRRAPGSLTYVSSGVGSILHLATEVFMYKAGINMVHVPYTGSGPAIMDLMAGRGDVFITAIPTVLGQLQDKSLKLLAVTSEERSPLFPDTPTLAEEGVPDVNLQTWWGIVGPPNMPPEIVAKLNASINQAAAAPSMKKRFADEGAVIVRGSSTDFGKVLEVEHRNWRQVIEAGNLFSN